MAFSSKELEIIKFGQSSGKSRAQVEQAISSYRSGVVPTPVSKTIVTEELGLGGKLLDRAKNIGGEALTLGTLGASTLDPNTPQNEKGLAFTEGLNKAAIAPFNIAKNIGGAIGDVVGAGITATGLDVPIAKAVAPIANTETAQKAMQAFQSLPKEYQDYLGGVLDIANIPLAGGVKSVAQAGISKIPVIKNVADIKNVVPTKLGQKAVDLISQDPGKKVETILKRTAPEELNNYLSIAEKSSLSGEAKSVFETVGDKLAGTTKTLKTKLDGIGAAKSEIIKANGNINFTTQTQPLVTKLEGIVNSFTEIDKANSPLVQKFIADAKNIKTTLDADSFIDKAQDALYTGDRTMTLPKGSALEKKLQQAIGEYNSTLKASVPAEYTLLNQQYAKLVDTLEVVNRSLGEVVEGTPIRGAGLIKQYFSPAGSKTKEIFEFIKKETNGEVDLAKDATLAKFAGQLYDDPNVGSLLGGIKDIPTTIGGVAARIAEKIGGEKVTSAMRQSTIRKARETISPKFESGNGSKTTPPVKSKLLSLPNSTPKEIKGKGIRGMIELNPKNWFEEVGSSAEAGLNAKTKDFQLDMAKEAARTMRNNGVSVKVATPKNAVQILKDAKELARKKKVSDVIKAEMPSDKIKPFIDGGTKKSVIKNEFLQPHEVSMTDSELFSTMKLFEEKLKEKTMNIDGKKTKKSNSDFMAEQKTVSRIRDYLEEINYNK